MASLFNNFFGQNGAESSKQLQSKWLQFWLQNQDGISFADCSQMLESMELEEFDGDDIETESNLGEAFPAAKEEEHNPALSTEYR